jgi:hypothetical protein
MREQAHCKGDRIPTMRGTTRPNRENPMLLKDQMHLEILRKRKRQGVRGYPATTGLRARDP